MWNIEQSSNVYMPPWLVTDGHRKLFAYDRRDAEWIAETLNQIALRRPKKAPECDSEPISPILNVQTAEKQQWPFPERMCALLIRKKEKPQ